MYKTYFKEYSDIIGLTSIQPKSDQIDSCGSADSTTTDEKSAETNSAEIVDTEIVAPKYDIHDIGCLICYEPLASPVVL